MKGEDSTRVRLSKERTKLRKQLEKIESALPAGFEKRAAGNSNCSDKTMCGYKEIEQALRESEERYRRITQAVTDYIFTVRVENGRPIETIHGAPCVAITGYTPDEFRDDPYLWIRMVHPSDREFVRKQADAVLSGQEVPPFEHRLIQKSGEQRWVNHTVVIHRNTSGVLLSYDGLIRDITERKRAEEAMRESEERYRRLVELSPDGIIVNNQEKILFINSAGARILGGQKPEDLLGQAISRFFPHHDAQKMRERVLSCVNSNQTRSQSEEEMVKLDGKIIFIEWVTVPFVFHGEPAIQIVFRDITDRKQAEAEKRLLEEQLRHSQKMEAMGRLAGGVAHDFNNLLSVVLNYTGFIKDSIDAQDPFYRDLEEIEKASKRAANLTRQLLAFSRKELAKPTVVNLNEVVAELDKMLRRAIGEDITLTCSFADDLWMTKIDIAQIEQVLVNLAINARDAMLAGGQLVITTSNQVISEEYARSRFDSTPGEYVMLSVSDTGMGMTPDIMEHLFEPFFTTKEKGVGTGLGLATVYGIVKGAGGQICVYSEPGVGSQFKIFLPHAHETAKRPNDVIADKKRVYGTETVLLVEDELQVRNLTERLLTMAGYKVLAASSADEALALMADHDGKIDLLLTDVVMPVMSGRQLAKNLCGQRPGLRVLYMSGYADDIIDKHGVLEPGISFLAKPFSPEQLFGKIREALDNLTG
jgi:two-component system cell cycle sensor histidine kinase/response regulator CckA